MPSHLLSGRLEETEEELVQLKIEREAERQRKAKYGTANGAAVEAVNITETPGEGGEEGGETWEAGETTTANRSLAQEQTTSQGKGASICMRNVLCKIVQMNVS